MGLFSAKSEDRRDAKGIGTVIGADACFEGTLVARSSICIEGTFRGELRSEGHVVLNRNGILEADVVAQYVSINGSVTGNVRALQQLDVGETGVIRGDVEAAAVTVTKGGVLEGTCRMIQSEAAPDDPGAGRVVSATVNRGGEADDLLPDAGMLHSEGCLITPEA